MSIKRQAGLIAFVLAVTSVPALGARHRRLTKSVPSANAVIHESPKMIQLWFSESTELSVSHVGLEGPSGSVDLGNAEGTDDPKSFMAAVTSPLGEGEYRVSWRTAGDDGHVLRGEYFFNVSATDSHSH
jgi:methionine-rich copper-binding protein CopC